tara:strand:- start:775 stop:996 length:222 start_codon:yes stop_codon:yes gene_type:complete
MENIEWVEVALTILTTGFFSLVGFVWKFSHKVTALEKDAAEDKRRIRRLESDHDKVMDKMYSIVKSKGDLMNR